MKPQRVLAELKVPSDYESLSTVRRLAAAIASDQHFSVEEIDDFKIAVVEAVSNSITVCQQMWGHKPCQVRVTFSEAKGGLSVDVASVVPRSNRHALQRPELPGAEDLELMLIRCLVDEVDYVQDAVSGVQVRMVKYLLG